MNCHSSRMVWWCRFKEKKKVPPPVNFRNEKKHSLRKKVKIIIGIALCKPGLRDGDKGGERRKNQKEH